MRDEEAKVFDNGVARLYHADARDLPLPDKSVHMVCTSPPYHGLRDYGLGEWEGGDPECDHARQPLSVADAEYLEAHKDEMPAGWRQGSRSSKVDETCRCDADVIPATVLDCFVGSGTTVAVAQSLGRRGIGTDLNADYLEIAKRRIGGVNLPLGT